MSKLCFAVLLVLAFNHGIAAQAKPVLYSPTDTLPCEACHEKETREFRLSVMAEAASTQSFLREQQQSSQPERCLKCHAPQGKLGVACVDCHGIEKHPYPKVKVPQACAQCHDAPGENTFRSFRQLRSQKPGKDCIDCHTSSKERFSHEFIGVTSPGFLEDVAWLRLFLRKEQAGKTDLLIEIRHRAGHALPGGTTGRSVWLTIVGINAEGKISWEQRRRFGWEHGAGGNWLDKTLPPGKPKQIVIRIPDPDIKDISRISAKLIYRFMPGVLTLSDPRETVLDSLEMKLN